MVCDNCYHKEVCVFEKDVQQRIAELNIKVDEPLEIKVTCKHHMSYPVTTLYNDYSQYSDRTNCSAPYPPGGPEIVY